VPSVVLGVSGSVACYRAADLARELMRRGFTVRVCLTDAAQRFVSPALFEALTGQPCLVDAFDEPDRGRMAHIDWARQANVLCVAPATANTVARLAHGIGDDMLTTLALATTAPWVVAPAMNPQMYASDAHQAALRALATRAAWIVEPVEGEAKASWPTFSASPTPCKSWRNDLGRSRASGCWSRAGRPVSRWTTCVS
jgi:phosphopantothenoylcysteine decarboxylase / phosphopantothenate---cysteine ligase